MARANLKKSKNFSTSTTTASKYTPKRSRIWIEIPPFRPFCNFKLIFYQEKKKESEFTVPTKPVRGKTTNQPAEKSESFKIYSDVSLKSEPTSSSLLEDTKMLLQVCFFQDSIKKKCIFSHFMKWNERPVPISKSLYFETRYLIIGTSYRNRTIKWRKISGSGSI